MKEILTIICWKGKVEAVVTIPVGFEADFMQARKPDIPIRTLKGQEITGSLKAGIDITLSSLAQLRDIRQPESAQTLMEAMRETEAQGFQFTVQSISTNEINQGLNFASGYLIFVLAMSMMQATSLILEEKHWNTLSRVRQAPVGKFAFLMANFLTAVIFLILNLLALFIITRFVMPVKLRFRCTFCGFTMGLSGSSLASSWHCRSSPGNLLLNYSYCDRGVRHAGRLFLASLADALLHAEIGYDHSPLLGQRCHDAHPKGSVAPRSTHRPARPHRVSGSVRFSRFVCPEKKPNRGKLCLKTILRTAKESPRRTSWRSLR